MTRINPNKCRVHPQSDCCYGNFSGHHKKKIHGGLNNTNLIQWVKMAEEQDGEITFSSTNSSKEQQNGEESLQNNF